MNNDKRHIEVAFPLRQASVDSVHEKNVRHGHISTLHIWPARRPLAACRAALIATLLPDPGDEEQREAILKRLGGTLKKITKKKKMPNGRVEYVDGWETAGGILHWGRESGPDLDWFREEIRKAFGGRAPKVLDPFAGGGAIPLEAMRLGCEVTAVDINPVAWFILKCTLEYPQKLAGQKRKLPDFALQDREFMSAYFKAKGLRPAEIGRHVRNLSSASLTVGRARPVGRNPTIRASGYASLTRPTGDEVVERGENFELFDHPDFDPELLEADLAWHVRAWGRWVLKEARKELARFYPTYTEYCTVKPYRVVPLDTLPSLALPLAGARGLFRYSALTRAATFRDALLAGARGVLRHSVRPRVATFVTLRSRPAGRFSRAQLGAGTGLLGHYCAGARRLLRECPRVCEGLLGTRAANEALPQTVEAILLHISCCSAGACPVRVCQVNGGGWAITPWTVTAPSLASGFRHSLPEWR